MVRPFNLSISDRGMDGLYFELHAKGSSANVLDTKLIHSYMVLP